MMRNQIRWRRWVWVALALPALVSGCGKAQAPWEIVYPTSGVVKYQGKPLAGAVVTLIPLDKSVPDSVRPTAITDEEGGFEVGTYSSNDGAPAGEYKVLVLHFPTTGTPEYPQAGPNDLPAQFSRAETTPLKVTVDEEPTELKAFEIE
ncbi:MAG: carboxypeptidase regulatory-like domain-containing protein [Planctomycetes bacterium]|nr:carboxypeptidase regulatory-like domain-containing protein [Planctomycetota bacterium]